MVLLVVLVLPSGHASSSPPSDVSAEEQQTLHTQAAQEDAMAQYRLGLLYADGKGVPQDYGKARQWWEQAAAQGDTNAQDNFGALYADGHGMPQNNVKAYMWWSLAAPHLTGRRQELIGNILGEAASRMTSAQLSEAQRLAQRCQTQQFKSC
jgi:TPR repeat protein